MTDEEEELGEMGRCVKPTQALDLLLLLLLLGILFSDTAVQLESPGLVVALLGHAAEISPVGLPVAGLRQRPVLRALAQAVSAEDVLQLTTELLCCCLFS